jgi:spore germination protein GerM
MSSNAGLIFFDILTNQIIGQIDYTSTVEEIFDVKILINTNNPAILTEEIEAFNNIVTYPGNKFWKKDDLL